MNDPLARLLLEEAPSALPLVGSDSVRPEIDSQVVPDSFLQGAGPISDDDYWDDARRPFVCLAFLAPLLAFYELGAVLCGPGASGFARNGADSWLRGCLAFVGLEASWLLPALVLGGLLGWQALGRHRWTVRPLTLAGMSAESLLLAFVLIVMGHLQDLAFQQCSPLPGTPQPVSSLPVNALPEYVPDDACPDEERVEERATGRAVPAPTQRVARRITGSHPVRRPLVPQRAPQTPEARFVSVPEVGLEARPVRWTDSLDASSDTSPRRKAAVSPQGPSATSPSVTVSRSDAGSVWRQQFARCVLFVGAGVYEEFLFRLLLLPALVLLFTKGGVPASRAGLLAILWTSVLFSAAHYIGPGGDSFSLFTFLFRFLAGLFFATVFLHRGFGIVVGCHAAYDLLVGLMLPLEAFTG
jgi:hypothetical protein